jgi:hypothetical protein
MHDIFIEFSQLGKNYPCKMSHNRFLPDNEPERSRDPRHRDRSRSEIRRSNTLDVLPPPVTTNEPLRQEESTPRNGVLDFLKTLGLNSQLIQALLNANPPKLEQIPQQPPEQSVNNAQEFASFLSKSYRLDPPTVPTTNQPINRGNNTLSFISIQQFFLFRPSTSTNTNCSDLCSN